MSKAVVVGNQKFATKKAAILFFRAMLNRYRPLERVQVEDEGFLRQLFNAHPERNEKLAGQPISHFEVHPFEHGTHCFFVVKADGSKIDFSFYTCIDALAR